jgi:hypothetical protein
MVYQGNIMVTLLNLLLSESVGLAKTSYIELQKDVSKGLCDAQ